VRELLESVAKGDVSPDEAARRLGHMPFEDLGFARVDHHRALRCGFPEVIFCQGKSPEQAVAIAAAMRERGSTVLASRADDLVREALATRFDSEDLQVNDIARTVLIGGPAGPPAAGTVAVVSGGTSDMAVAEEARVTAEAMGSPTETVYDAGVAGIHRLLESVEVLREANALVVVAGMEGALPSVVGGLVEAPVIAVPTSIGYGASFGGVAALLAMLNSCASGVAVVNIDNGFGAGFMAALINRRTSAAAEATE